MTKNRRISSNLVILFITLLTVTNCTSMRKKKRPRRAKTNKSYFNPYKKKLRVVRAKKAEVPTMATLAQDKKASVRVEHILGRLNKIEEFYRRNAYYNVIIQYEALREEVPLALIPNTTKLYYGTALLEKSDVRKAAVVFRQLKLAQLQLPKTGQIMYRLGNYYMRQGSGDMARRQFEQALNQAKEQALIVTALQDRLNTISVQSERKDSAVSDDYTLAQELVIIGKDLERARQLAESVISRSRAHPKWSEWGDRARQLLEQIGKRNDLAYAEASARIQTLYLESRDFPAAWDALEKVKRRFTQDQFQDQLEALRADLEKAEKYAQRGQEGVLENAREEVTETYKRAEKLAAAKEFRRAIALLNEIEGSEISDLVIQRKNRYIESYVKKVRGQSAKLFLKGRRIGDPTKKVDYYLKAYKLLEQLSMEYPEARQSATVNRNLDFIANELAKYNHYISRKDDGARDGG